MIVVSSSQTFAEPRLDYSMMDVRRAGKRLTETIPWNEETHDDVVRMFQVINNFRDAHVIPMKSVRASVAGHMRGRGVAGFTAARSKTLPSIRRKIRRHATQFDRMNDLAGVRAVADDMAGVNALHQAFVTRTRHEITRTYDYIAEPKPDGYRSRHLALKYHDHRNRYDGAFEGRRVELQIRTRLQHAWATAVEAIGLYRGEDLKAGKGDPDWLRLFALVSEEFAYSEGFAIDAHAGERNARLRELRDLDAMLQATAAVDNVRQSIRYLSEYLQPIERPSFYRIVFNRIEGTVAVSSYSDAFLGLRDFHSEEAIAEDDPNALERVVFIEAARIAEIKEAFPNYFGDVRLFAYNLARLCHGEDAIEYSMAPQEVVAQGPIERGDPSWLRGRSRTAERGRSSGGSERKSIMQNLFGRR